MRSLKNAPPVNGFVRRLRDMAGTSIDRRGRDHHTAAVAAADASIVDFGALFYCYLGLENGVSQATRFAVTGMCSTIRPTRHESVPDASISWPCDKPRRR
jgi:hypothetical protein